MTEEEIEKKAEKKCKLNDQIHRDCYVAGFKEGVKCGLKQHAHDYLVKTKALKEENNKLLDVINNQDVKIADLEKQIEKMKNCQNCKWQYCECSSAFVDKDTGKETKHCWNEEKEKYCDVGFEGKYQCWELKE